MWSSYYPTHFPIPREKYRGKNNNFEVIIYEISIVTWWRLMHLPRLVCLPDTQNRQVSLLWMGVRPQQHGEEEWDHSNRKTKQLIENNI